MLLGEKHQEVCDLDLERSCRFDQKNRNETFILWHVDKLLGDDREIGDCTAPVATQRHANNRGMVFSARFAKQQLTSKTNGVSCAVRAEMFKAGLLKKLVYCEKWLPGKNVSTEAEDIVGSVTKQRLVKTQQNEEK
jgi:hypothetical protein